MLAYLDFTNHEADISPQLHRLQGVAEEPELLMPSGVIDVEGDARAEGGDGEPRDLVLADLGIQAPVEMARHVWPDQEGELQVKQAHGENVPQPRVVVADQGQRALDEQRWQVAEKRDPRRHGRRWALRCRRTGS